MDFKAVESWRGRTSGSAGLTADEVVQRIAAALWATLDREHVEIRAGIDREAAAAVLIIVWEQACTTFNVFLKFDAQPDPIRALMREL